MNIIEIYKKFPTHSDCLAYLEHVRWNNKPKCPYCQSKSSTPMPKEHRHHCNNCKTSYSVTVRTIFHNTKLDLQKWFLAISMILNAKKGISARQLGRHLDINKNTAWFVGMRIRKAMLSSRDLLTGIVEMDETYIGGKPRKGSDTNSEGGNKRGRGTKKVPVVGMMERGGKVKAKVIKDRKLTSKRLSSLVRGNVDIKNSTLMTDEFRSYSKISDFMKHQTVNHQFEYVNGVIHTNSIEGFWALLKRGIVGQYHKVSVKHLPKYLDEFCFRYNNRKNDNIFDLTISRALGVHDA